MSRRKQTVSELRAIAAQHLPRGWTWEEREEVRDRSYPGVSLYGVAKTEKRRIITLPVIDRYSLAVFLHECAHVACGHRTHNSFPIYLEEYEAEQWAIKAMQAAGVAVPRLYVKEAKDNVRARLKEEGLTETCPAYIKRWIK